MKFSWPNLYARGQQWLSRIRPRRVSVLLQMTELECGAACLAMVLSYYGRRTEVAECRQQCGVGRDGLTGQAIAQAARHYGLRVKAYSISDFSHFASLTLPAIVHWNFNHFVVLEAWSSHAVTVVDPVRGRLHLTIDEFDAAFTGVVLSFTPGVHFKKGKGEKRSSWRNYLAYILKTPRLMRFLGQALVASLLLQLLGLISPLLTKVLIDDILPFQMTNILPVLGIGMVILILSQSLMSYLRSLILIYLQARLDTQMMLGFFEHVLSLPFSFFQQRSSGDLLMRLGSNATIRDMLTNQTISTILDGSLVFVYLFILLSQAPTFGLVVLVMGTLQVVLLIGTARRMRLLVQHGLQAQADSQSYLVEALTGIATLKASGVEDRALDHWSDLFFESMNHSLKSSLYGTAVNNLMLTLRTLSPLILLWVGAYYVLNGQMTLGTMMALTSLAGSFLTPLSSLIANGQQLQTVGAHFDRIMDVAKAPPEQEDSDDVQSTPPLTGSIEVKGLSFRYDANGPLVLRDISFKVKPGQKVAIVGQTGSGKSTLAKLLLALYEPTTGTIEYDNLPLTQLSYRSLRRQIGVVLQESFLFNGPIRHNIAFNDPDMPLERVVTAARQAAIHQDITQMPMGYESVVAEGGSSLSGGQRQRLSLARALAHLPAILILDEATSHLDVTTEALVNENISQQACTRIVIAHRLSTVRDADLILVLEQGEIVERGSHADLMACQGAYAALVRSQQADENPLLVSADKSFWNGPDNQSASI